MDFPGNSHSSAKPPKKEPDAPKEKQEKVISGEAVQRKKGLGRKFKDVLFDGQLKTSAKYILTGVLLPSFKNMVVDATTKGIERIVYGENAPRRTPTSILDYGRPRVSYNTPVDRGVRAIGRSAMLPDQPPLPNSRRDIGEIVLATREEAELVLERLGDIVEKYDVASVADLLDLVGLPNSFIDNKWGWNSLGYSAVRQVRDGYMLDLPMVQPI